ncbi:UvrD-helicase domain-containing protein [Tenacibaculum finnmarkense]|uniref:UvrD-helicase domain-containing protein n=1 Tax=Tenacibaculum finnmarkense TaxID=2781243 RepID=UPI001E3EA3A8|nr:UvrD-helicase domain-containing protein [Tenacibaculum finnmarkense]MCD8400273.1 UvrD-helicase domain-containing protein [Tenacibaculum finnmarkense genomovar ulcerans]
MKNPSNFQVYNASAGSGKTFTLVKEYLKVLLNSEDIFRFQKILAITFTNKAAGEMKERVLENLQEFSQGKENDLFQIIIKEISIDKEKVQERSQKILDAVLQNYSAFSITTIDSFTHRIIKSFAYDLGLPLNFEVEMDAISLLNEAVDVLISKIGTDTDLTKLLIDFSLDKADDDTSWDISVELNEFSRILLNEDDTEHFRALEDKKLSDFTNLKSKLFKNQRQIKTRFSEIGKKGLAIIETAQLEAKDFYYSMLPKHFLALSQNPIKAKFFDENKLREHIEENNFYSKSKSNDIKSAIEGILPELLTLYMESEKLYQQFLMNKLALKSVIPLAVLNYINVELTHIKEENNIRLNAEFNQLISDNIKDQPAPFIYERIGERFMHYFIDEMQDTSVLQWENIIPLIDNALAQENSNLLLVGDGKQAIYRWRGGKAEQFISLGSSTDNPFHIEKEIKTLETNFRSYTEVIDFNNQFFQHTANFLENQQYKKLFIDGNKQLTTAKNGGFVSLSFLDKEEEKADEQLKYPKKILETIQKVSASFSLNEICVLVRKKKDGVAVANYLSENGVNIISSETLLLENSASVKFMVDILQIIQHPNDKEALLEVLYFLHTHLELEMDKNLFISEMIQQPIDVVFEELKIHQVSFELSRFHQLPFYEKVEEIIRCFKLIDSSDAYVQFFLDIVLEQQRRGTSIQEFLDFWEEKKANLSIVAPESGNAVQIMTIHKSKGLEFPVVIFPYDLDIYRQINPKIWLDDLPSYFDDFKELLVPYNKDLKSINERSLEIFNEQRSALELDNFNLLYVALTRAVEQLHIITEYKISKKGEENTNFYSGVFINYLKEKNCWNDGQLDYHFGNSTRASVQKEIFSMAEVQEVFISTPWQAHNIHMLASASKLWNTEQGKAIEFGNLIHEMMAKIMTQKDIARVVRQYEQQGVIDKRQAVHIEADINKIVSHPELQEYFSENATVYNEREIVDVDNQILIPDRLVLSKDNEVTILDYKTGKPSKSYHQQLLKYERVLKSIHYKVSKKLLIYINEEILVEEV